MWTEACPEGHFIFEADSGRKGPWKLGAIYEQLWGWEVTYIHTVSLSLHELSRVSHGLGINDVWGSLAGLTQTVSVDLRRRVVQIWSGVLQIYYTMVIICGKDLSLICIF